MFHFKVETIIAIVQQQQTLWDQKVKKVVLEQMKGAEQSSKPFFVSSSQPEMYSYKVKDILANQSVLSSVGH